MMFLAAFTVMSWPQSSMSRIHAFHVLNPLKRSPDISTGALSNIDAQRCSIQRVGRFEVNVE
jgi:hypothetical protein